MKEFCIHHPASEAVVKYDGKGYCKSCDEGQKRAAQLVETLNPHVTPSECFITYADARAGWKPLLRPDTGCAHWVAHTKGIKPDQASIDPVCLMGYAYRVRSLVRRFSARQIDREQVRAGDLWVDPRQSHCGIVAAVRIVDPKTKATKITIRHDSSQQGGVRENDLDSHWRGDDKGTFYRA